MYTMVSVIKINACSVIIRMWKIAQPSCNRPPKIPIVMPALNIMAIRIKIISPAYMLPNSRNANDTGLAINDTNSRKKLTGINRTLITGFFDSNGCNVNSAVKPPIPLFLMVMEFTG